MLVHVKSAFVPPILMLCGCLTDTEPSSLARELGSDLIDQQQPEAPDWGLKCTPGETGGYAQGVTPGVSRWEAVSAFMFTIGDLVDQPVRLEVRDGAPDGPTIASATATVPDRSRVWTIDYTFAPPVEVTPGSLVYLVAEVDDRVAWSFQKYDPYPDGDAYSICGDSGPRSLEASESPDFAFITYAAAGDSDGDGIDDDQDPDVIAKAIEALPDSSFAARGHRSAIVAQLAAAEAAILAGHIEQARDVLQRLRSHVDGCEGGASADADDWITDCADQDAIRDLIDDHLA